jgi:hypothetical protein
MDPASVDLHDGRLVSVTTDVKNAEVVLTVDYYQALKDSQRTSGKIIFHEVSQFNATTDLDAIRSNANPGNISDWTPSAGLGTTFIYLVGGVIAVTAKRLDFVVVV